MTVVAVAVVLLLVPLAWWLRRVWAARIRRIQEAAAADVAAVREDARLVSPDAPGNHEDDL